MREFGGRTFGRRHSSSSWVAPAYSSSVDSSKGSRSPVSGLQNSENEDADPVGAADPTEVFTALAVQARVLQPGAELTPAMLAFATLVVDRCATIADAYGDDEAGGNAGENIRAELYG